MQTHLKDIKECINHFDTTICRDSRVFFCINLLTTLKLVNKNKFVEKYRPLTPMEITNKIKQNSKLMPFIIDILAKPTKVHHHSMYISSKLLSIIEKEISQSKLKKKLNLSNLNFWFGCGMIGYLSNNLFFDYTRHFQKEYIHYIEDNSQYKITYKVENGPILNEIVSNVGIDDKMFHDIINKMTLSNYNRRSEIISIKNMTEH